VAFSGTSTTRTSTRPYDRNTWIGGSTRMKKEITMDRKNETLNQESRQDDVSLARADRRLLFGASIQLLGLRFSHGQPIFQSDVIRIAAFADDAQEHGNMKRRREEDEQATPLFARANQWFLIKCTRGH
jgi:hypothetical protein